jgi:hypothetical protein
MNACLKLVLAAALIPFAAACGNDVDFDSRVAHPAFTRGAGPTIMFDHGHHNHHEIGSTYKPFARLLENDGFRIVEANGQFSPESLRTGSILVIVAAQSQTDTNDASAFTAKEVQAVADWVKNGGSLLLITDHYPFPNAAAGLARAFGLDVGKGMVFDTKHFREGSCDESRLIFSRANGLLGSHPITAGRNPSEEVSLVETFTGDAFKPPASATALMTLAPTAQIYTGVPEVTHKGADTSVNVKFVDPRSAQGWVQGAAFPYGSGRVVALAEAAMATAQEDGGRKLGMNAPGNDNRQFVLNTLHWLAHLI